MNCANCLYFREKEELPEGSGQCLANPPAIVATPKGIATFRPQTFVGELCRFFEWKNVDKNTYVSSSPIRP